MRAPFDLAETYRAAGWTGTLPLPPRCKAPVPAGFTGYDGAWPSGADLAAWRENGHQAGNLALRLPPNVVGLDIDNYGGKNGLAELRALEEQWGPLPPTWYSTSRDDGSRILFYLISAEVPLDAWPTGASESIEIIRFAHRYAVVWPSVHPEGRLYWWHRPDHTPANEGEIPKLGELAWLPTPWIVGLTGQGANGDHTKPGSRKAKREGEAEAKAWLGHLQPGEPCTYVGRLAGELAAAARRENGNAYDNTRDTVLALLRAAETGHPGVRDVLLRARGDYAEAVKEARAGKAAAEGEFDRFTIGGAAKVLDTPGDRAGTGCDCYGAPVMDLRRQAAPAPAEGSPVGREEPGYVGATWQALDLGPYVRGEVERDMPTIGLTRKDGLQMLYPGKEHTCIGEMEAGKSWFALGCASAELTFGNRVLYVHFEESDPGDTVQRLQLLGVPNETILERFTFVGPGEPVDRHALAALLEPVPSLVVLDGVNEAMSLHGWKIMEPQGAADYRRHLVKPCTATGAAVLSLDHVVKDRENRGRNALGSIHKGNGITGSLILLENAEPFGRDRRGVSHVFVGKDRPGHLRRNGREDRRIPGKFYMGTLVVDDTREYRSYLDLTFFEPKEQDDSQEPVKSQSQEDDDKVLAVVTELVSKGQDPSTRDVRAVSGISSARTGDSLTRLVYAGKLDEHAGSGNSRRFTIPASGSDD